MEWLYSKVMSVCVCLYRSGDWQVADVSQHYSKLNRMCASNCLQAWKFCLYRGSLNASFLFDCNKPDRKKTTGLLCYQLKFLKSNL